MDTQKNNLLLPVSIIVAGALVGGGLFAGLYFSRTGGNATASNRPANQHLEKNLKPVTSADHIKGSPSAPVMIVEYSDTDCYYCNAFKPTLDGIMKKYESTGKVAQVYRSFNTSITGHPNTLVEAEALECVAELGGNEKFWQYLDLIFSKKNFQVQPAKLIDPSQLPVLAVSIGVNQTQFSQCLNSGKYSEKIAQLTKNIKAAGGSGTPYSFIVSKKTLSKELQKIVTDVNATFIAQYPTAPDIIYMSKDNKTVVVGGALDASVMNQIIDLAVKSNS